MDDFANKIATQKMGETDENVPEKDKIQSTFFDSGATSLGRKWQAGPMAEHGFIEECFIGRQGPHGNMFSIRRINPQALWNGHLLPMTLASSGFAP